MYLNVGQNYKLKIKHGIVVRSRACAYTQTHVLTHTGTLTHSLTYARTHEYYCMSSVNSYIKVYDRTPNCPHLSTAVSRWNWTDCKDFLTVLQSCNQMSQKDPNYGHQAA